MITNETSAYRGSLSVEVSEVSSEVRETGRIVAMVERDVEMPELLRGPERRRTGGGAPGFRLERDRERGEEFEIGRAHV